MYSRPGPRPTHASCQNPWLAKIGLVEIPKHSEDGVEDNQGFQPEQVYRMEEKRDRKNKETIQKRNNV